MQKQTIAGLTYHMVEAPSGSKRFVLVGPDAKIYAFETAAQRWDMVDYLRTTLEDAPKTVEPKQSQHDAITAELGPDTKTVAERLHHRNTEGK